MTTEVYIASVSSCDIEKLRQEYDKIRKRFISTDGGRVSERPENILGRVLLNRALIDKRAGDYTVEYVANEKPRLITESGLYFNISHSGDLVALALSDREVGCDIQEIRPYNPKVAKRNYSEKETEFIENSEDKDKSFIRFWALKESVLKYTGKGISGGLSNYDFASFASAESFRAFGCSFYVTEIKNMYFALCHEADEFKLKITDF